MGKVIIQEYTTKNPITLIGEEAGICYSSDTSNSEKNYKRGLMNLKSGHGRTFEFPQVYLVLEGYSARVIRELYTHIAGDPTRLQASTRYIDYSNFDFIVPDTIAKHPDSEVYVTYLQTMRTIMKNAEKLSIYGVPKEDIANILPLGMTTKIVLRTNLRQLIDMSHQRLCTRAYWEFRQLMKDIMQALADYSLEWKYLVNEYFKPKCELYGYCNEHNSCGRKPKLEDTNIEKKVSSN